MKTISGSQRASSLFGILLGGAFIALVVASMLPVLPKCGPPPERVNCVNNLRQMSQAFHDWTADRGGFLAMEVADSGTGDGSGSGRAWTHFQVLSNYLVSPKVLICAADKQRKPAKNWGGSIGNENISYFVNVDARLKLPQSILGGDRNMTNRSGINDGILTVTTNDPGFWTSGLHNQAGNIALTDGSVQQVSSRRWVESICYSGVATNRLAMP